MVLVSTWFLYVNFVLLFIANTYWTWLWIQYASAYLCLTSVSGIMRILTSFLKLGGILIVADIYNSDRNCAIAEGASTKDKKMSAKIGKNMYHTGPS
jgi:hypothetical protein